MIFEALLLVKRPAPKGVSFSNDFGFLMGPAFVFGRFD